MATASILVVQPLEGLRHLLVRALLPANEVLAAGGLAEALALLQARSFDLVVADLHLPGDGTLALLEAVRGGAADTEVVVLANHRAQAEALRALEAGAADYLQKPVDAEAVARFVGRTLRCLRYRQEAVRLAREVAEDRRAAADRRAAFLSLTYRAALEGAEQRAAREYLTGVLATHGGNVSRAAEHAGVERETLHRLLRNHGVRPEDFRGSVSHADPAGVPWSVDVRS